MKIEELKKEIETENKIYRGRCHDCGKPVEVSIIVNKSGQIEISGGAVYKAKQQYARVELFFKCDACFMENRILEYYKKCDVYSRVVGYLRPVNQWNKGKVAEWNIRKEFINPEERKKNE